MTVEVFGSITKGEGWDSLSLSLLVSQGAIMFLIVGKSLCKIGFGRS